MPSSARVVGCFNLKLLVASVRPGTPAKQIFLRPGDVISKFDDKGVRSGQDIDSANAASASGAMKVTGPIHTVVGMVPFEREVKVR